MVVERKHEKRRILAIVAVAVAVLTSPGSRFAQASEPSICLAHENLGYGAMRVIRDPETGRLVVRRADRADLASLTLPDVFAPVPIALSVGGYKVDTRAGYLHFLSAGVGPVDGAIHTTCATDATEVSPTCAER